MYEYMKGKIIKTDSDSLILEVGNIAYKIYVTNNNYCINNNVLLYIYYFSNENVRLIYGFSSDIERDVFSKILNIRNIGIKTAFNILKNDRYDTILDAAFSENYDFLLSLNKINEDNVELLVKSLKQVSYNGDFVMNKEYYSSLKALDYSDSIIFKTYKLINKNMPLNLMIKESINIIEAGDFSE